MSTGLHIRIATPSDAEGLAMVRVKSWQTAYKGLLPNEVLDSMDLAKNTARFMERLEHPKNFTSEDWVYERDGCVIGWLSWMPSRDSDADSKAIAEILALYVLPELFGEGVGHALMEAFLSKVRSLDSYNETTLWVLENNQRAKDFYERHGFQLDGASKDLNLANLEAETAVKAIALEVRYRRSL